MKFSFIITAYNPGEFVINTIKSILNQTYQNFEIIYLDDCSTDNSFNLIQTLKDERLIIFQNKIRIGLIKSLNLAISKTICDYIIRFDADDIILPTYLESRIQHLEKDIVLLGENIIITNDKLEYKSKTNFPTKDKSIKKILFRLKNSINQPGVVLKRTEVIKAGGYYEVKGGEDYDLWIRLGKYGKFKNTKTYQVLYRTTENSLTVRTIEELPKTMISSITKYNEKIFDNSLTKIFLYLFKIYNYKRGYSFKKIIIYPFYHLYALLYSSYLKNLNKHF